MSTEERKVKNISIFLDHLFLLQSFTFELRDVKTAFLVEWLSPGHYLYLCCRTWQGISYRCVYRFVWVGFFTNAERGRKFVILQQAFGCKPALRSSIFSYIFPLSQFFSSKWCKNLQKEENSEQVLKSSFTGQNMQHTKTKLWGWPKNCYMHCMPQTKITRSCISPKWTSLFNTNRVFWQIVPSYNCQKLRKVCKTNLSFTTKLIRWLSQINAGTEGERGAQ